MSQEAVYGIIFSDDRKKVLFVQRRDLPVWVLPGGGLDAEESPSLGVVREVFEETGLKTEIVRHIATYFPINRLTATTHLFECTILEGTLTINAEARAFAFFSVDALPARVPPPFTFWIQDAQLNSPFCLHKNIEGVTYTSLLLHFIRHPLLVTRYLLSKIGIRYNTLQS